MADRTKKTCIVCGANYRYCSGCAEFASQPIWRTLFDTAECKDVFEILSSYNSGCMSKAEARKKISALDLKGIKLNDSIKKEITALNRVTKEELSEVNKVVDEATKIVEKSIEE